jgi:hypothetical protein
LSEQNPQGAGVWETTQAKGKASSSKEYRVDRGTPFKALNTTGFPHPASPDGYTCNQKCLQARSPHRVFTPFLVNMQLPKNFIPS